MKHKIFPVLLALALLSGSAGYPSLPQDKINGSIFPVATPESQGISTQALNKLKGIVQQYFNGGEIVGAELLVIKNRHTILHEAFGWLDREQKLKMVKNTLFNIRSMTKSLTGAGIQILTDRGKLSLQDPVARFLPAFDNQKSRKITIEQVLSHQSGLPLTLMTTMQDINRYPTLQSLAEAVGKEGPQFEPGSKFWYSDAGADVLGAVIEKAAGQSLDQFIYQNLIQPLGMGDTRYNTKRSPLKSGRVASSYFRSRGKWWKFWNYRQKPYSFYPCAWGSQTLFSTPLDYARFLAMWMYRGQTSQTRILTDAAVKRSLTPHARMKTLGSDTYMPTGFSGLEVFYGQMAIIHVDPRKKHQPVVIGHTGSDGTYAWAWPQKDLMVLYFTQSRGNTTGIRLEKDLDELLARPEMARKVSAPDPYKPYLGKYTAKGYQMGNRVYTVLYRNGGLAVDIPGRMIVELKEPDSKGFRALKISSDIGFNFKKDQQGNIIELQMTQVTRVPKTGEKVTIPGDCPENLRNLLGRYSIMGQVVTAAWKDGSLEITLPGTGYRPLTGPDKNQLWQDPGDPGNKFFFEKDSSGRVKSLHVVQKHHFSRGEAAAVLVEKAIEKSGLKAGLVKYHELKRMTPGGCFFDEGTFNTLGYKLLNQGKLKEALEILKLNVKAYPGSWNAYDSLGEAYLKNEMKDQAIINYIKSLELNPENSNARKMLDKLKEKQE